MKLSEYVKICSYEYITLSVYYTEDDYSNEGTFSKDYCLEYFGDYEIVDINHTTKIEVVKNEKNKILDTILITPRLWIRES